VRTPLNAILGWLQILRTTDPSEDRLRRALDSLERNARSQARVIEDLLDVSRMVTGKLQVKMAVVDLCAILAAAVDAVKPSAMAKSLRVDLDLPATSCLASADRERLQQVVWNLLSNAVKFTPAGGSISVSLSASGPDYVFTVRDTGIGITKEFLPFVFDHFRQADGSMTRQHGGLGLGLAIVKEVTELHNGSVTAASRGKGHGATFTVHLPQLIGMGRGIAPDAPRTPGAGLLQTCAGVRVLAVDDDPDSLEVVKAALTAAGAEMRIASTAGEAISAWQAEPGDVLLCDLAMPDMDGFQLLSRIQALDAAAGRSAAAAVALTAYTSDDYRQRCLAAGFHGHVGKPYTITDLTNAIIAALAQVHPQPTRQPSAGHEAATR
jgi:CheY-like chemotaxis protein